MRVMVTIHFDPQQFEAISALIPKEQEHVRELMGKGVIEAIYIGADRTEVWLVMKGESKEQLEQEMTTFPLYPYMKLQFAPLLS
ncbi:MAG TPA: muconolactone Delta-isomerase family protein [Ktedonobacteraceae bacterium]|nr:muconolactone Delta-isomerase family protein [Ktedonobacteraceae bacterium]